MYTVRIIKQLRKCYYPFRREVASSVRITTLTTDPHLEKYKDNASLVAAKCT